MEWVENLYKQTKIVWEEAGRDPRGYAIFYSPVRLNPFIALIGVNPGGGAESFDETTKGPPTKHEYFREAYPMAEKMKRIFSAAGMLPELEESVKFNLLFFRSREAKDIKDKHLIAYSREKALEILDFLKPKVIITEGFSVFDTLKVTKEEADLTLFGQDRSPLIFVAKAKGNIPLIGLKHPSSGHTHVSEKDLEDMGKHLNEVVRKRLQLA